MENKITKEKIEKVISEITEMPTFIDVLSQLVALTDDPLTSASDLVKVMDQSLAVTVLKVANSAFFGHRFYRHISTIEHAIALIGFNTVRELALSSSFIALLPPKSKRREVDLKSFCYHSILCAVASKLLAKVFRSEYLDRAYSAGLIHDIGKTIIAGYFPKQFKAMKKFMKGRNIPALEAERAILGVTHAEVGGWFVESWNLPYEIEEAVRFHHQPHASQLDKELTFTVSLANNLSKKIASQAVLPQSREIQEFFTDEVGFAYDKCEEFTSELLQKIEKAQPLVDLITDKIF
ncbi:MAG: HDOD domain-containing protein [Thermodesulfobacteriota bacterium]|nr:HDOD domain-containing protein [Thermodesulfobacteriota bacterium]